MGSRSAHPPPVQAVADPLFQLARQRGLWAAEAPSTAAGRAALARAVAEDFGMPFVELGAAAIPGDVLAAFSRDFAVAHTVMPCGRRGGLTGPEGEGPSGFSPPLSGEGTA